MASHDHSELQPDIDYFRELTQAEEYNEALANTIERYHARLIADNLNPCDPNVTEKVEFERKMLVIYRGYHEFEPGIDLDFSLIDYDVLKYMYKTYGFGEDYFYVEILSMCESMEDFKIVCEFMSPMTPKLLESLEDEFNSVSCLETPSDIDKVEHLLDHGMGGFEIIGTLLADKFSNDFSTNTSLQASFDNCVFKILSKIQTVSDFDTVKWNVTLTIDSYKLNSEQTKNIYNLLYQFCPVPTKSARTREERDDARKRSERN